MIASSTLRSVNNSKSAGLSSMPQGQALSNCVSCVTCSLRQVAPQVLTRRLTKITVSGRIGSFHFLTCRSTTASVTTNSRMCLTPFLLGPWFLTNSSSYIGRKKMMQRVNLLRRKARQKSSLRAMCRKLERIRCIMNKKLRLSLKGKSIDSYSIRSLTRQLSSRSFSSRK